MSRLGSLKPGAFPDLRWSFFCGEPLPTDIAQAWSAAAPNSSVENLYGPTEATIAATVYRWEPERSPAESRNGIVPIGIPFPGMTAIIADESLREQETGEGELLLSGPQISLGYWEDQEKTDVSFVIPPGKHTVFYRTGDRVRRESREGPLTFLGRLDHQIKVQGYRVELGEVEACIRKEAGVSTAVAVGWPLTSSGAAGIEAFITEPATETYSLQHKLKAVLPKYALPRKIHRIEQWPLNSNGKIDRKRLLEYLEGNGNYERPGGRHSFIDP
jgi:acyl-coenzyme A synthetase/AMP-(fatty) acid ligase